MQLSRCFVQSTNLKTCRRGRFVKARVVLLRAERSRPSTPSLEPTQAPNEPPSRHTAKKPEQMTADGHDRQELLGKAWNFLAGASGVMVYPYISIFLAQHGLTSSQIGLLSALRPWVAAPASMAASAMADKYKLHTQLMVALGALSVVMRSSLPLAAGVPLLFGMLLVAEVAGAPANVLGDATVLSNCKDLTDFGKQRQWASIGYGLLSPCSGWLIASFGLDSAFMLYFLASLPLLAVGTQMRYRQAAGSSSSIDGDAASKQQQQQQQHSAAAHSSLDAPLLDPAPFAAAELEPASPPAAAPLAVTGGAAAVTLRQVVLQPRALVFLWRCLLMGFAMGVMANFEFLFLKQLGAPETLMGLAIAVSICTEVPAFRLQGSILHRISPSTALNIVLAATVLRLACYAALPLAGNVWAVLPVELLHGLTFGLAYGTATVYSSQLAPPQLSATMQGVFQATYSGVGAGLGGLVGGILLERQGGQGLFLAAAGIVAAGGLVGAVADGAAGFAGRLQHHRPGAKQGKSE